MCNRSLIAFVAAVLIYVGREIRGISIHGYDMSGGVLTSKSNKCFALGYMRPLPTGIVKSFHIMLAKSEAGKNCTVDLMVFSKQQAEYKLIGKETYTPSYSGFQIVPVSAYIDILEPDLVAVQFNDAFCVWEKADDEAFVYSMTYGDYTVGDTYSLGMPVYGIIFHVQIEVTGTIFGLHQSMFPQQYHKDFLLLVDGRYDASNFKITYDEQIECDNLKFYDVPDDVTYGFRSVGYAIGGQRYGAVLYYLFPDCGEHKISVDTVNIPYPDHYELTVKGCDDIPLSAEILNCLKNTTMANTGQVSWLPYKYKKTERLSFSLDIPQICSEENTFYQWEIFNTSFQDGCSVTSLKNEVTELEGVNTSSSVLEMDAITLPYGSFVIYLEAIIKDGSRLFVWQYYGFIEVIIQPSIVPVLFGGHSRSHPYGQPLILNATGSYDPDEKYTSEQFSYNWTCTLLNGELCDFNMLPDLNDITGPAFMIPAQLLTKNTIYSFTVVINVPDGRKDSLVQTVCVFNIQEIAIRCKANCQAKIITRDELILQAVCNSCESGEFLDYSWNLYVMDLSNQIPFPEWINETTTGINQTYLVFEPNTLQKGLMYLIAVTGVNKYSYNVNYTYNFTTNMEPARGKCDISPSMGYTIVTDFEFECYGFDDEDLPVTYKVYWSDKKDIVLYIGNESSFTSKLNAGDLANNYTVNLTVEVFDVYNESIFTTTEAQVYPYSMRDKAEDNTTVSDAVEYLYQALNTTEPGLTEYKQEVVQYLGDVMAVLNDDAINTQESSEVKSESEVQLVKRKQVREAAVEMLENVTMNNMESIKHVTGVVYEVTKKSEEITNKAVKSAVKVMTTATEAFKGIEEQPGIQKQTTAKMAILSFVSCVSEINNRWNWYYKAISEPYHIIFIQDRILLKGIDNVLMYEHEVTRTLLKQSNSTLQNNTEKSNATGAHEVNYQEFLEIKDITEKSLNLVDGIADTLLDDIESANETAVKYELGSMTMELEKVSFAKLKDRVYESSSSKPSKNALFLFPNMSSLSVDGDMSEVNVRLLYFENNPYTWSGHSATVGTPVVDMVLKTKNNTKISVKDTAEPFDIIMPRQDLVPVKKMSLPVLKDEKSGGNYFDGTLVTQSTKPGLATIILIKINHPGYKLKIIIDTKNVTSHNIKDEGFQYPQKSATLMKHRTYTQNESIIFLPALSREDCLLGNDCLYYIGIVVDGDPDELILLNKTELEIQVFSSTLECVFWNKTVDEWMNSGCEATALSSLDHIHCWCNHLTAFAGSFIVLPNAIDPFDVLLFTTFFDNPIVIAVVILIWLMYFGMLVWAKRADREDVCKSGVTVLPANEGSGYMYLVCTVTGWWRNASTTANVFMFMKGVHGQSQRYFLYNMKQDLFQLGGEDWFLVCTPFCVGELLNVTVWHDNKGQNPSWFLKEITIFDLQKNQQWYFLYDDWLSVDHGPGIIKADIPVVSSEEISNKKLSQLILATSRMLRNSHLWASIFVKPYYSKFTRVQRLSCSFCLLLLMMLTNIMFYGIPTNEPADQITTGYIVFSFSSFVIGIQSALIIFPVSLIIVEFFELSARRSDGPHVDCDSSSNLFMKSTKKRAQTIIQKEHGARNITFGLALWLRYIAWILLIVIAVLASYFVMLYGLHYGYNLSVEWLISFFTSFFQSCFVIQPVKVFFIALIITLILRKPVDLRRHDVIPEAHDPESYFRNYRKEATTKMKRLMNYISPPPKLDIITAIQKRLKMEKKANETLQDVITYFIFLGLVLFIVHSQNDVRKMFQTTDSINMNLINSMSFDYMSFHEIEKTGDIWIYLLYSLVPKIYSTANYPFAADGVSYLIGPMRLRQVRIASGPCPPVDFPVEHFPKKGCLDEFWFGHEDTTHYNETWNSELIGNPSTTNPWVYHTAWDLSTIPHSGYLATYPGGGYTITLSGTSEDVFWSIVDAYLTDWVDRNTVALFIEFTLFNPVGNTFSTTVLLVEFSPTGKVFPFSQVYTSKLYLFSNSYDMAVVGFQVLFLFQTVVLTVYEVKRFKKLKKTVYWKDTWRYIEIIILMLSYAMIGLYFQKLILIQLALNEISDNKGSFISFYPTVFWDQIMNYVSAFLSTILIIKIIYLCKFNVKMTFLSETLHRSGARLLNFSLYFFLALTTFSHTGTLLFGHSLYEYRNYGSTLLTCLNYILGIADYYGIKRINPVLGRLYFCIFFMIAHFYLSTLLIALVLDAFRSTRLESRKIPNEAEVVDYIWRKIILLTARKKNIQRIPKQTWH